MKKIKIIIMLLSAFMVIKINHIHCAAIEVNYSKELEDNLQQAAKNGDIKKVLEYLHENVNVNSTDENSNTSLILAANAGHIDVVKALLDYKKGDPENQVNVNYSNKFGQTALMYAIKNGHTAITRMLLDSGRLQGKELLLAAEKNDIPLLRELLKENINLNLVDEERRNALMIAAIYGYKQFVEILLNSQPSDPSNEINVNAQNFHGENALMLAARQGHADIVSMLLDYKQDDPRSRVNVNALDLSNLTALMHAVHNLHPSVVKILLEYKKDDPEMRVDVNVVDRQYGQTALIFAVTRRDAIISPILVKMLLENDQIDVNVTDKSGFTALALAVPDLKIVKMLIDSGKVKGRNQLEKAMEMAKSYGDKFYDVFVGIIQPLLWQDEGHVKGA